MSRTLSIIMVCLNAKEDVKKTLNSISEQGDLHDVELVVQDGCSQDGSGVIIDGLFRDLVSKGAQCHCAVEPDRGIYDAMNKAVQNVTGSWVLFLNAGDVFFDDSVLKKSLMFLNAEEYSDVHFLYGDTVHRYESRFCFYRAKDPCDLTFANGMEFCHQSCFIRASYMKQHLYRTDFRIVGDYAFFIEAFRCGAVFKHLPICISIFNRDGVSSTDGVRVMAENALIQYEAGMLSNVNYIAKALVTSAKRLIKRIVPSKCILARQRMIMKRITQDWGSFCEVANAVEAAYGAYQFAEEYRYSYSNEPCEPR